MGCSLAEKQGDLQVTASECTNMIELSKFQEDGWSHIDRLQCERGQCERYGTLPRQAATAAAAMVIMKQIKPIYSE